MPAADSRSARGAAARGDIALQLERYLRHVAIEKGLSANTVAATYCLAEKGADLIKGEVGAALHRPAGHVSP